MRSYNVCSIVIKLCTLDFQNKRKIATTFYPDIFEILIGTFFFFFISVLVVWIK